ncbi:hypothetical protein N0V93_006288 [Gnomoniopsis smithogilvyi]|uniref:Cytochrome P450 n=1 Tax=Gnomoniopsis smithogilvyi TaxID=1191159 RepID=A0A9W8YMZ1_9PEZI|nr:hypothetical protein N0V93_006288 [Gnomoniopsis smithogilvyi]
MLAQVLVAALVLLVPYLWTRIRFKRLQQYARFPQLPASAVLGHLQVVDDFIRRLPPKAHPNMAFAAIHDSLGRPPVVFVDLRPASSPMLVIGSFEVAEQIIKATNLFPHSPPKALDGWAHLVHLTGTRSIMTAKDEEWKMLRKRFNPGFAHQNLMTLLPSIVTSVSTFLDHLDDFARTGEAFTLQTLTTDLTFDIMGKVALDIDIGAQTSQPTEFLRYFRALIETYTGDQIQLPRWCTPLLEWKRTRLAKQARTELQAIIRAKFAERATNTQSRSVLAISLEDMETLSPDTLDLTCDQLSSFLFAGHDTTSTTICWMIYELSRSPRALRALREELAGTFGAHASRETIISLLLGPKGSELMNRMTYASAVIKETLRLWPSGATARMTQPGDGLTASIRIGDKTEAFNLDGLMLYHVHTIIQRDPAVFGENADQFVPERWLDGDEKFPAGAWRPFERGPRNCIGQALALIEARVVLAMVVGRYEFDKVGLGEARVGEDGQVEVAQELYMTMQVTPKPVDGMLMRVRLAH